MLIFSRLHDDSADVSQEKKRFPLFWGFFFLLLGAGVVRLGFPLRLCHGRRVPANRTPFSEVGVVGELIPINLVIMNTTLGCNFTDFSDFLSNLMSTVMSVFFLFSFNCHWTKAKREKDTSIEQDFM